MKYLKYIMFCIILSISTSCVKEYKYTPPETQMGKTCVVKCQSVQRECRQKVKKEVATSQKTCEKIADNKYNQCQQGLQIKQNACLRFARTEVDRLSCVQDVCFKDSCFNTEDYTVCDQDFNTCYQNCGGIIGVME